MQLVVYHLNYNKLEKGRNIFKIFFIITGKKQILPSIEDLRNILESVKNLPTPTTVSQESKSMNVFALQSLVDLRNFITLQLVQTLKMDIVAATETAIDYTETLVIAGYNYTSLCKTIYKYKSPKSEFKIKEIQLLYGHLLECLWNITFEKYPKALSEKYLDIHLTNIVRLSLDYFIHNQNQMTIASRQTLEQIDKEKECDYNKAISQYEMAPMNDNTINKLSPEKYILVSVSVDTVLVDEQLLIWQISIHIPNLPETEDPDYECLILPEVLRERGTDVLTNLGFIYNLEQKKFYHQSIEFGKRKVETEEVSLEKFKNYLDEIRKGFHGAGPNKGLVLLFETGEDLALLQQLLSRHGHDIFLDVVKRVASLDHYLLLGQANQNTIYRWPVYQYRIGEEHCWTASVTIASITKQIRAETKPECIYKIYEKLLEASSGFLNIKCFTYPIFHSETIRMKESLKHILELLPLQNYIEWQLFSNKVRVILDGVYTARNEIEAAQPYSAYARQIIRRLVSLNFTLDVLKKILGSNNNYEIPNSVFLYDMTEVQKLQMHSQTKLIKDYIKQYFV